MLEVFKSTNRKKIKHLLSLMIPIILTQTAFMGMHFFDASMSGQAGPVALAGTAIGGNIWMPIQTGFVGMLMATMPMTANLLGEGRNEEITRVVRHGLLLALGAGLLVILLGALFLEDFLMNMGLEPEVYHVAFWYLVAIAFGVIPFFFNAILRCLVDTLGYTQLTMKVFLTALPINGFLNYVLIFGKFGLPALGGIGAGIATAITFWILLFMFLYIVTHYEPFKSYQVIGCFKPDKRLLWDYLKIGFPMGCTVFMETSVFGVVALFVAKFGTLSIAAHQAALNFSSLVYMIPLGFSLATTIVIGIEYGAKRYDELKIYGKLALELSFGLAMIYIILGYIFRYEITIIYAQDPALRSIIAKLIIFACMWQLGDAVAEPCQGILRGMKEINATFYCALLAYWIICLPLGLFLDYYMDHGMYAYWQSLVTGVVISAMALSCRLYYMWKYKLD